MCPEGAETLPWDITQLPSLGWWWLFSRPVPSDSSRPPGLQHARTPVPYHLPEFAQVHSIESTISSSVAPFSSCPQSFPASGSFPMSRLSASGVQSIGASAACSISPSMFRVPGSVFPSQPLALYWLRSPSGHQGAL